MIYVVHPIRDRSVDITPALRWGEVRYINKGYLFADDLDDDELPPEMMDNLERVASLFNPRQDFLLIVGDHAQLVLFAALLAARHPYFRVLRYDRQAQAYYPIRIPGTGTGTGNDNQRKLQRRECPDCGSTSDAHSITCRATARRVSA